MSPFTALKRSATLAVALIACATFVDALPNAKASCTQDPAATRAVNKCSRPTQQCQSYLGHGPQTFTKTVSVVKTTTSTSYADTITQTTTQLAVVTTDSTTTREILTTTTNSGSTLTVTSRNCAATQAKNEERDAAQTTKPAPSCLKNYNPKEISSICSCLQRPTTLTSTSTNLRTKVVTRTSTTTTTLRASSTSYTSTVTVTSTRVLTQTVAGATATTTAIAGLFALKFSGSGTQLDGQYALTDTLHSAMQGTADLDSASLYYVDISDGGTSRVIFDKDTVSRLGVDRANATATATAGAFGSQFLSSGYYVAAWCTIDSSCAFECSTNPASSSLNQLATCDGGATVSFIDRDQSNPDCDELHVTVVDVEQPLALQSSVSFGYWGAYSQDAGEPYSSQTLMALSGNVHISFLADTSIVVYDTSTSPWTILSNPDNFAHGLGCGDPSQCPLFFQDDGNMVNYDTYGDGWQLGTNGANRLIFQNTAPYVRVAFDYGSGVYDYWTLGDYVYT